MRSNVRREHISRESRGLVHHQATFGVALGPIRTWIYLALPLSTLGCIGAGFGELVRARSLVSAGGVAADRFFSPRVARCTYDPLLPRKSGRRIESNPGSCRRRSMQSTRIAPPVDPRVASAPGSFRVPRFSRGEVLSSTGEFAGKCDLVGAIHAAEDLSRAAQCCSGSARENSSRASGCCLPARQCTCILSIQRVSRYSLAMKSRC